MVEDGRVSPQPRYRFEAIRDKYIAQRRQEGTADSGISVEDVDWGCKKESGLKNRTHSQAKARNSDSEEESERNDKYSED